MSAQTLLITGGCGYLGAHLLRRIAADDHYTGACIRVLDNMSSGSVSALLDLPEGPRYEFVEADILAPSEVRIALEGVDTVFHLAAVVRTPFAFDQPASVKQVNQWGTVRLLEHCQEAGVRRFLYASSTSVYGTGGLFSEMAECRPIGPYSSSKLNADHAVLAANGSRLDTAVLRIATLYGGEPALMRFDAVANRFVYLAGTARSLAVFGNGEQMRPLVHVRDAARALLHAHQQGVSAGEIYNVVEDNVSIGSLAELLKGMSPQARIRYTDQDYREHLSLAVSSDKLRDTGWIPGERLENGLNEVLAHFRGLGAFSS